MPRRDVALSEAIESCCGTNNCSAPLNTIAIAIFSIPQLLELICSIHMADSTSKTHFLVHLHPDKYGQGTIHCDKIVCSDEYITSQCLHICTQVNSGLLLIGVAYLPCMWLITACMSHPDIFLDSRFRNSLLTALTQLITFQDHCEKVNSAPFSSTSVLEYHAGETRTRPLLSSYLQSPSRRPWRACCIIHRSGYTTRQCSVMIMCCAPKRLLIYIHLFQIKQPKDMSSNIIIHSFSCP